MGGSTVSQEVAVTVAVRQAEFHRGRRKTVYEEKFKDKVVKLYRDEPELTVLAQTRRLGISSYSLYQILAERGVARRNDV